MDKGAESVDGFPPVQHLMYCAEQIIIPQPFPDILKTFAKAAIRTQPYDLLRWSAAYFRCMTTHVPPPVKQRLERDCRFGTLTRGYLRVLLEQLGRGFFVNRELLQNRWESMALPETELLSFLSLGRMLHWPQVHWLKLFALMVGSLNGSLLDTMTMLCELLTDDVEGSPSAIPMWMLRECYVFLAELDCGDAQRFVDGRKIIGENLLEDPSEMPDLPKLLSLESFRNAIVEKFNERLGVENNHCHQDFPYRLEEAGLRDATNADCPDNASDAASSIASSRPSHISSSFRFIGDYADPTQLIRRTPDFDSVILLLHEAQGYELHRYEGPHSVAEKTLRHAIRRDVELRERREHQAKLVQETADKITVQEHDRLLLNIEPPWSWIHQFAASTTRDKSYNFLEYQSVASDETPPESSDESFDFERSRFHRPPEVSDTDESCERGVEDMLLKRVNSDASVADDVKRGTARLVDQLIDDVMGMLERAMVRKQITLENTQSVATFVLENDPTSGKGDGGVGDGIVHEETPCLPAGSLNLAAVRVALRHADEQHMVFKDLLELREYLERELRLEPPPSVADAADEVAALPNVMTTATDESEADERFVSTAPMSEETQPPPSQPAVAVHERPPLVDKFEDCNVEVDEKLLSKKMPDQMILGLVQTPPRTPIVVPTPPATPSLPPTTSRNTTSGFITANLSTHEFPEPYAKVPYARPPSPLPREPFRCDVPAMPGIGRAVGKETIVNFVTYLTGRARTEMGLVFPRHFREAECPNAVDTFDM